MLSDVALVELKIEVERTVGPIRATRRRKDRIRHDLWSHLAERAEVLLIDGAGETEALASALARLGDRAALAAGLQAAVPCAERLLWTRLGTPRRLESAARRLWGMEEDGRPWRARRAIAWAGATALVIALVLNPFAHWALGRPADWGRLMALGGLFCGLAIAVHGVLAPFVGALYAHWLRCNAGSRRSGLWARGVALSAAILAAGWCFGMLTRAYYVFDRGDAEWLLALALISPLAWAGLRWCAAADRLHWEEWESLAE